MPDFDVLVIGGGPAGLSASVYTARAGYSTAVALGPDQGGLLLSTETIENYLGLPGQGSDLAESFLSHSAQFCTHLPTTVNSLSTDGHMFTALLADGTTLTAKAVIGATGSIPTKLGPSESPWETPTTSYCATCDGMFYVGDKVVLVGGGETAAEDALYLSNVCDEVIVLVRSKWRATPSAVAQVEAQKNVAIIYGQEIVGIEESDRGTTVFLSDGGHIDAEALFVAIGQTPQSDILAPFALTDESGYAVQSQTPGFFLAGDVRNPDYRQVAIAVGDGARAGIDCTRWLNAM